MLFGEHEFHLGEGYVQLKGSNFSESADSKGECQNQISTSLQSYITPSFCFQLIAVARALLKKASILFLDEVVYTGVYIRSAQFSGEVLAILESLFHLCM